MSVMRIKEVEFSPFLLYYAYGLVQLLFYGVLFFLFLQESRLKVEVLGYAQFLIDANPGPRQTRSWAIR